MIKIFNANDRDFSTVGNIIIEPIKCNEIKKKSLNGWYIDVEVPIKYKDYISKDKLCVVKTKSKLNPQAFRIGEEINYTTRKIKFKAEHVMFDSKDYTLIDVRPTNQNGLNALNYINQRTDETSPFSIYSNVENINTAYFIRKNLLESWTIIEERWGGAFDADNWNISFLTSVGNDNGETIAYGKNMQGFDIFEDWSSVCTKLCPVGYDGLMLPEQFLTSDVKYGKPYTRIIDFQTDLESEDQTEENLLAELRAKAEAYLEENKVPKVSYTIVSNINGNLEIGDTIKVLHPFVNIFTEVLEYEYNLISQKVVSLTFGNYTRDVKTKFENIKNTIEQVNQAISKQEVVINNQTNLINSLNKNGILYIDDNELLLLDSLPKEKAKNVWRFGLAGIGFSSNGYEGPFEIAITMDGQINADFITTGTMSVSRIEGLANFISETAKQIAEIEIEQGNITSRVSSTETQVATIQGNIGDIQNNIINLQSQIDGSIQFWNGSEIPTLNNYPANEWTVETDRNNHRADIYTVIQDIDGELKQGKSYRFDKVGNTWQWIELTDNELSAVQALATSKAKVFVVTPTVPYSVGDLWLNNGKLYRCKTSKDSNGSYSSTDWEIAVNYTDDTVAELAKTLANNAQSTADSAVNGVNNITNTQGQAEGKSIHIEDSAEEPFIDIELYGETSQKTKSGKNIFNNTKNFSAVTYNSDNDVWEFNITNRYDHLITKGNLNIEANTDYVLVLDIVENTLTGGMSFYTSNTVWLTDLYINKEQTGIIKKQLHSRDDLESALYDIWFWHDNTITGNFKAKIMLCKGILGTEGDYEQYGVMPSPDYPSEIENLEGKNRYDGEIKSGLYAVANGSYVDSTYYVCSTKKLEVISGKTLTVSNKYEKKGVYYIIELDKDENFIGSKNSGNVAVNNFTFTLGNNTKYILIDLGRSSKPCTVENVGNFQIEEGSVATPYAPYNSLEFKVEGKNKFSGFIKGKGLGATNGAETTNETKATSDYIAVDFNQNPNYYLSGLTNTLTSFIGAYNSNKKFIGRTSGISRTEILLSKNSFSSGTAQGTGDIAYIRATTYKSSNDTGTLNDVDNLETQLEIGGATTDYEPYKSQVAYFPLGEGEKLYQGSFLNDNGKNHTRGQYVFTGTEGWSLRSSNSNGTYTYMLSNFVNYKQVENVNALCSHFKYGGTVREGDATKTKDIGCWLYWQVGLNDKVIYINSTIASLTEFKTWLATEYANGTPVILEYELAEPETVPYTEVQQEAWDKIEALMTYKNITNITSDAYAKVTYMRDNGLDVYETKQNAQKRYTETSEKLAEQKITVDGVVTQISQINSKTDELTGNVETINSSINTIEQTINGWSQELKNTGGNNIFYYSLDFWDNSNGLEEYSDTEIMQNSISQTGYVLNNGSAKQTQSVKNGFYTCSFNYKKLLELAVCQVKINGTTYDLTETDWAEFEQAFEVKTNVIEIEFISDTDSSLYISDLMVNVGKTKLSWSQNANETRTDTVTIGKGIQVNSSAKNTYHRIDADGNRTFNKATGKVVNEATDKGTETEELVVRGQAKITGLLFQKASDQVWINSLL